MKQVITTLVMIALVIALILGVIVPIANKAKTFGDTRVDNVLKDGTTKGDIPTKIDLIKTEITD